jgi:hypothetical protein
LCSLGWLSHFLTVASDRMQEIAGGCTKRQE